VTLFCESVENIHAGDAKSRYCGGYTNGAKWITIPIVFVV
jgi:hypothetical protein